MESNAGRVLRVGLPGLDLDDPSRQTLQRLGPAGVILFARNLETPDRAGCLLRDVVDVLPGRPLLALDQEGGRVARLPAPFSTRLQNRRSCCSSRIAG